MEFLFYATLLIVTGIFFTKLYMFLDRKDRYESATRKRQQRLESRKFKAERLAKYGPPGIMDALISLAFDHLNEQIGLIGKSK